MNSPKRIFLISNKLILFKHISCAMPLLLGAAFSTFATDNVGKPNILFVLTDDQRWNTLGCMGATNILTPNIDQLARQGVLFRNHFVTTSICCSSRASILTGQYMRRHGIHDFSKPFTTVQWEKTYPALLRQNGYRTGFIGKFGVGNGAFVKTMADKFDYWRGLPGQGGKFFIDPNDPNRMHETARFGNDALEFLRGQTTNQPFCLSVSFTAPHARDNMPHDQQYQPDERDRSLYTNGFLSEPVTASETYFHKLPKFVQSEATVARERWHWRFGTPQKNQQSAKDYYRLITGIDREVGRMMAELETLGMARNTVVVFTSDNGYFLGDRGLSDKFYMYEESLRVPLIIYNPRMPAMERGRKVDMMTLNIDFAPTMLALAGVSPPGSMQGRSLFPFLECQNPADWRTDFYYEEDYLPQRIPPSRGVRTEQWSYIRWVNETPVIEELFNLGADPLQGNNLAGNPTYAQTLQQLRARCDKYQEELK